MADQNFDEKSNFYVQEHPSSASTMPFQPADSAPIHPAQIEALHSAHSTSVAWPLRHSQVGVSRNESRVDVMPDLAWHPRADARHLSKGANGIWYFRLAIPERVRALHPELPKEIRRSTRTGNRCHALAISRKMCLDFCVRLNNIATTMLAPDDRHKQAFCIEYIDGAFRSECSPNAKAETILLMGDLMKVVMTQVVGRGRRAANDAVAPAAPHAAREDVFIPPPPSSPSQPPVSVTSSIDADVPDNAQNEVKWLSDAIEEWAASDATSFSEQSWTYSYKPTFRVFRELVGDRRRDRTTADGTFMPATLDIPLQHLTRQHMVAFHEGLKELPARQGQRDDGVEAPERIRKGKIVKLPPPSLESVCKKRLCRIKHKRQSRRCLIFATVWSIAPWARC